MEGEEQVFRDYYGKNYEKVRKAYPIEIQKLKTNFLQKYPNATLCRFEFSVTFVKDGTLSSTEISYKVDEFTSYDITSETFLGNPKWTKYLYWKDGWRNVKSDMIFRPNPDFAVNFHTFKIYVSETDSFPVDLEYTTPEYTGTGNFVNLIPFDYHQNSYFRSLAACYIATFKSGISENHLNNTLPDSHLITSIVKFHVHYQMEKFMKDSRLMDHYLNEDDLYILGKYMPTTETWERRTLSSHANLGTWYYGLPADTRRRIRNHHYVRTRYGGTILMGYNYFDESEDLKKKVTEIEKTQQVNTAEIVKNVSAVGELNDLGKNYVQYDVPQMIGVPGFYETGTFSVTDRKNAKFITFGVGGFEINSRAYSSFYGFYDGSGGNVVINAVTQRSTLVRATFTFAYGSNKILIIGLEFKNISSTGRVSNRMEATDLKCFLVTT
ncbi:Hypothetical predicted protein [Paramuricea clavata]|uniref:Uncharacterized protein n=1 Tax=Paramuricea clavata TaxID=317549 RepID=A0A6S7G7G4_PARCT|nr:Hypothetical predicted protein [Paramuricea clavata]